MRDTDRVKARWIGRIVGYLAALLLPCLIYLLYATNGVFGLVDKLDLYVFGCPPIVVFVPFVFVYLIATRRFGYILCMILSVLAGVVIEGEIHRPLQRMDLMLTMNLARYEAVVLLAERGLLTPDPEAGANYINPERSYQLPKEYSDLTDSHRIQITDTDLGRFVAFYGCGIALSRCSAYVYSSNPGMPLPKRFFWPLCREAALGAYKNWLVCIEY
jgi:hypothetical protein